MRIFNKIFPYTIFFISIFIFFFFSCKKDKPVTASVNFGYNYYPNDVGHYVIYQVDSIYANNPNQFDSTRYQLKELIAATFLDNSGRPTLRMERYYKMFHFTTHTWDSAWSVPKVWSATRTQTTLERKEENITYLRFIFPPRLNTQWNGNVYNTLGDKEYQITSLDLHDVVGGMPFDSVALVSQFQSINLIQYQNEFEKYARNVGLIYKERDSLYFGTTTDTLGYKFKQQLLSFVK